MLSGIVMKVGTFDDDFIGGPYNSKGWPLSDKEKTELEEAVAAAIALGFIVGKRVRRRCGGGGLQFEVGTIAHFAKDRHEGFHQGKPTPVVVRWKNPTGDWTLSYATSDLELIDNAA